MLPRPLLALPLTTAASLLLLFPVIATPQMVVMEGDSILVYNTLGLVAELNSVGDLIVGGNNRNGDVLVKNIDGDTTITLSGGGGDITVGGGGRNGEAFFKNAGDLTTLTLDATHGNMTLGGGIDDGDIFLTDTDGTTSTIHLNGESGTLRLGHADSGQPGTLEIRDSDGLGQFLVNGNTGDVYSNQLASNGLVKAWARINGDGTIASCWRCNEDTGETHRLEAGKYEIDFQVLGAVDDIRSRPWVCSMGTGEQNQMLGSTLRHISCFARSDDSSSIHVTTWTENPSGTILADGEFTIVIY